MGIFGKENRKEIGRTVSKWAELMFEEHLMLGIHHDDDSPHYVGPQRLCDHCVLEAQGLWSGEPSANAFLREVSRNGTYRPTRSDLHAIVGLVIDRSPQGVARRRSVLEIGPVNPPVPADPVLVRF